MEFKNRDIRPAGEGRGCVDRVGAVPRIESLARHVLKGQVAETIRRHDGRRTAEAVRLKTWRQVICEPNLVASAGRDGDFHGRDCSNKKRVN